MCFARHLIHVENLRVDFGRVNRRRRLFFSLDVSKFNLRVVSIYAAFLGTRLKEKLRPKGEIGRNEGF